MPWFIYIIRCTDNSLYTGITTNLKRRFDEHQKHKGAKYFYAHTAIEIVYIETASDRSKATKREILIKKLTSKNKNRLINSTENKSLFPHYIELLAIKQSF